MRIPSSLSPFDIARRVEETEARALARARDLVASPASNSVLLQLQEALRFRSELSSATSQIARAYDRSADRIIQNLKG